MENKFSTLLICFVFPENEINKIMFIGENLKVKD